MAFFKKNRQFNFKPKFQKETDEDQEQDIQLKWQELKRSRKRKSNLLTSPLFMVLFLIATLILLYILSGYQ